MTTILNGKEVCNLEIDEVDSSDYPDFCSAYICYACYVDGTPLSGDEINQLNEMYPELIAKMAFESLI
jgi:hypothetical protein